MSPIMAYSVCLYTLVGAVTCSVVRDKIVPFFQNNDEFENLVYVISTLLILLNCVCVPVFAWFDAPKAVEYLENWKLFQVRTYLRKI
jgi:hypothetical protein